jgi:hypothetical protein
MDLSGIDIAETAETEGLLHASRGRDDILQIDGTFGHMMIFAGTQRGKVSCLGGNVCAIAATTNLPFA